MSSEDNNLESNIQYVIEPLPEISEIPIFSQPEEVPSVSDFVINHIEEEISPVNTDYVTFTISDSTPEPSPTVEEPIPSVEETPAPEPVPTVEEPVPVVVEEPAPEPVPTVEEPAPEPVPTVEEPVPVPVPTVEEPVPVPVPTVEEPSPQTIPKLVFIVPYRDREQQYLFFSQHMKIVLEDMRESDYEIYYIHQSDAREFNRGAMKNIGFLYVKEKYPNDYENITLVFNDIDTMPYVKNFLNYHTIPGRVKHFYGFQFTLGGIVSIKAGDFEKVNGYPNFWAWGYEDNLLQKRVLDAGLVIDRSQFYPLMDKNILQMKDGLKRIVNRSEFDRYMSETKEGIQSIKNLNYVLDSSTRFVNVSNFNTDNDPIPTQNTLHDLRSGNVPFNTKPVMGNTSRRGRARMGMSIM